MRFKDNRVKLKSILDHLLVCHAAGADCPTSIRQYGYHPDPTQAIKYAREVLADFDHELAKVAEKVAARKMAALRGRK